MAKESALVDLMTKEEARLAKNDLFGGDKGVSMDELQRMNEYMQQRIEAITMGILAKRTRINELNEALNERRRAREATLRGVVGPVRIGVEGGELIRAQLRQGYASAAASADRIGCL